MKLQELREGAGFSQCSLAKATGISYSLIRNIEQGQKRIGGMSGERLYKLALALNCRMEDFLDLDIDDLVKEVAPSKNYTGLTWGSLREEEQKFLLSGANAIDGRTGNNMTGNGKCIIDLSVYPFSVVGEIVCSKWGDEIKIADTELIYNCEG